MNIKSVVSINYIEVVDSTHLKNISQIGSFPQSRGENKTYWKPPPRYNKKLVVWKFGLVVCDSKRVPRSNIPFHKGILGIQNTNLPLADSAHLKHIPEIGTFPSVKAKIIQKRTAY